MKKSLIALAVLAASGASFAQVTITGNVTAGFQSSTQPGGASASGFGVDTAEITFAAKEDLGGGMKASAKLGLVDTSRGNNRTTPNTGFGPGDASLGLSGSFGEVTLSTSRGTDYLSAGTAGVGGTFMDGRVFGDRSSTDDVAYSMPMGPLTLGLTYSEPSNKLGLGAGTSGDQANTTGRQIAFAVKYSEGPLVADVAYLSDIDVGDKGHYRGAASYDLGVAKLGGGFERASTELAGAKSTRTDMLLAVSAPLGPVTLGANWAQQEISDQATGNGTKNGYGLKAAYSLSKRTSVSADYTNWAASIGSDKSSQYNLFLSHSF